MLFYVGVWVDDVDLTTIFFLVESAHELHILCLSFQCVYEPLFVVIVGLIDLSRYNLWPNNLLNTVLLLLTKRDFESLRFAFFL